MRFHRSTERWFTNVNHSEQVESQGAQNTAGGEQSEHATRLLTGGPPAVFDNTKLTNHSHSVVPGGLDVKSYATLAMPGTSLVILLTISSNAFRGNSFPGLAGTPVMKSLVIKVLIA